MRSSARRVGFAAALAVVAGPGAAEPLAGQAEASLSVTIRVVDPCEASRVAAPSCGSHARVRRPAAGLTGSAAAPARSVEPGIAAVTVQDGIMTVIY